MVYNRIVCKGDGIDVDTILVQTYRGNKAVEKSENSSGLVLLGIYKRERFTDVFIFSLSTYVNMIHRQ